MTDKIPKQPLHPSVISGLDPEYVEFHTSIVQYITPPHTLPWDPAIRNTPTVPGTSAPLKVAKVEDFELKHTKFRAFTPEGTAPAAGWPILIYFHGGRRSSPSRSCIVLTGVLIGGWTLGTISSETAFVTNMCVHAKCVVVSIDYRLAPENPYPAAVEDAVDSLDWVIEHGKAKLNVDTTRIAVGGSSSGGNLATILALKAADANPPIPLTFQLLIVPVTDNTASVASYWEGKQHMPWLSPERMLWFRANYLPNKDDWTKWDASPIFAPKKLLRRVPKAWIGIAGMDILREEGIEYGRKMQLEGVEVEMQIYEGAPHPVMAMDGNVVTIGKKLVSDAANALARAFGTA